MQFPEDMPWVYFPYRHLHLTGEQLGANRRHLFPGGGAAPLSGRPSDLGLAQLLVCCTGVLGFVSRFSGLNNFV